MGVPIYGPIVEFIVATAVELNKFFGLLSLDKYIGMPILDRESMGLV